MPAAPDDISIRTPRKIARRLHPFLFLIYVVAYIDRVNVGYAGLDMTRELHFSNQVFGFGSGIFFAGFCLLEIPGALLAYRWSVRKLLATILITWGVLSSLTGFIHTPAQFNLVRFIIGMAEGGMFPAVVVYLSHWFREQDRARAVSSFLSAASIAVVLGGLTAGPLLNLHWLGLSSWRWLFLLEGIPSIAVGIVALFYLTDWPQQARWLTAAERDWITAELRLETHTQPAVGHSLAPLIEAARTPGVLLLTLAYFFNAMAAYGPVFWLPKIVQKFGGLTTWQIGLVASIPALCAIPASLLTSWHSDRTGERKRHAALAVSSAAIGFLISQIPGIGPTGAITGFSIAAMGTLSFYGAFWAIPAKLLRPNVAAAAVGIIALGNLGGFAGPYAIGYLTDRTGTYLAGILLLIAAALTAATLVLCTPIPGSADTPRSPAD